jgi:2-keto-4-pentenoate hydratase/2-oxohepta-3-ene-1,7-dioic acid hydratase in catechol pathway
MRVASSNGRLVVARGEQWLDVEKASAGRFTSDAQAVYGQWDEFVRWAATDLGRASDDSVATVDLQNLDVPVPRPRQIMAIGLNYREHAAESNLAAPDHPVVFTKFPSSLAGQGQTVTLPSDGIDWEVELVVVIGKEGHRVPAEKAWDYVAGITVGQDLSWREVQSRGPAPQFSIAKSFPGFSPLGPIVVTPDEFPNKDDIALSCSLNGEVLQEGRTSDLIFPVAELIEYLSEALTLMPGDLIFTGTPQRFLEPGTLVSTVEGVGDLTIHLVK